MSKLPLFEKNAYLSIVIKDNGIWSHLAYTDHNASREYILSDFTDLNPLRYRLDDEIFNLNFWNEYFNNLEKVFGWNITQKDTTEIFTFRKFLKEGDGVSGVRIQVDDNQKFFNKIFNSIRTFSNDISLRVLDDAYMYSMLDGLSEKMGYGDLLYIDMDIYDFTVYRVKKIYDKKEKTERKEFTRSKINWGSEFSVIDSIKDARFKAFLATDLSNGQVLNYWSNFVLNRVFSSVDPNVLDVLRAYSTIQNHSIFRDNREKLINFGVTGMESAMIVSGYIPRILGKNRSLLTVIDGLELGGSFDCFWDLDLKLLSYGKAYVSGSNSVDIILTRKDVLSLATKVIVPTVDESSKNKVVMSGYLESLDIERTEFFALAPQFTYIDLPKHEKKTVIECDFKNNSYVLSKNTKNLSFVSIPESTMYESLLVDARPRPIIYGPDTYSNKLKLQAWLNDNKA
ncbi:MAG: hypothetical protein AB9915_03835 [Candidatus Dojkabacteria bacterium]